MTYTLTNKIEGTNKEYAYLNQAIQNRNYLVNQLVNWGMIKEAAEAEIVIETNGEFIITIPVVGEHAYTCYTFEAVKEQLSFLCNKLGTIDGCKVIDKETNEELDITLFF